jgi:CDP-diacylglycerol--glycerol-3-phosphate 3-phosphatidyltransferase
MNIDVQKYTDNIIQKLFFWAIPSWVSPNSLSIARIIMTPFVYLLLDRNYHVAGFILLFVAICTDFLDGAIARKRDQITELGKVLDPVADKLLILTVLLYIGFHYWIVWVFSIFIVLEIITVISGAVLSKYIGRPLGANIYGKIKMILQSISVIAFVIGIIISNETLIYIAEGVLIVAFAFAILSGIEVIFRKVKYWRTDDDIVKLP